MTNKYTKAQENLISLLARKKSNGMPYISARFIHVLSEINYNIHPPQSCTYELPRKLSEFNELLDDNIITLYPDGQVKLNPYASICVSIVTDDIE